jgi:hypothetical protein
VIVCRLRSQQDDTGQSGLFNPHRAMVS